MKIATVLGAEFLEQTTADLPFVGLVSTSGATFIDDITSMELYKKVNYKSYLELIQKIDDPNNVHDTISCAV